MNATQAYVDREWYLKAYPDVAQAGMDPAEHFEKHGRFEGRMPCFLKALSLERDMWANAFSPESFVLQLEKQANLSDVNALYAHKALAAFKLFQGKNEEAFEHAAKLVEKFEQSSLIMSASLIFLTAFEAAFKSDKLNEARRLIDDKRWSSSNSKLLVKQMLVEQNSNLTFLNKIYKKSKLLSLQSIPSGNKFDSLKSTSSKFSLKTWFGRSISLHKVSVIVPLYNGADSIKVAIDSLLSQTWKNIEIIIVDDCSTDDSFNVVQCYAALENVFIVRNKKNLGAYPTRNKGVKLATGEFITVMDADDWAHPQKIEKQVKPLIANKGYVATLSHWARCNDELEFTRLRLDVSLIYRNVSSLMVPKSVFQKVGFWDELKASADTEFYLRLLVSFGNSRVLEVYPDVPLSLGRVHRNSLTQTSNTHLVTQFGGARQEHLAFATAWHRNANKPLFLDNNDCPFPVPLELCPEPKQRNSSVEELIRWRRALDNTWYIKRYDNVNRMGRSVHDHFWREGELLDYSPSPLFVPSAYHLQNNLSVNESATWNALNRGWDFQEAVSIKGKVTNNGKHIALFGHSLSKQVFGAEQSLIDMVQACFECGYKVYCFLPNATNTGYVETLQSFVEKIIFIPLEWFRSDRKIDTPLVAYLTKYILEQKIDLVYVNTIMLYEPYLAAQQAQVNSVTHVRELPEYDAHIQGVLREKPEQSLERLRKLSTYFIANSRLTARWLGNDAKTSVIYNKVNQPGSIGLNDETAHLKICMLSSNVQKKGIEDFFEVALLLKNKSIEFHLYGPETNELKVLLKKSYENKLSIVFHGYVDNVYQAIQKNDVVLCLSWFKESFGRTAAEAMICGRVVVGYDWGALSEVVDESCGVLVPFRNVDLVGKALLELATDSSKRKYYSVNSIHRAQKLFSSRPYFTAMQQSLESFMHE